jgi:hypothetical protein
MPELKSLQTFYPIDSINLPIKIPRIKEPIPTPAPTGVESK